MTDQPTDQIADRPSPAQGVNGRADAKADTTVDVVVAGSGAAAFAAAITAAELGLSVLMVESTGLWGGSSSMSGGGLWLPNNPLMRRAGAGDSREEALDYLERTVGDAGPATSRARKEAFVDGVAGWVDLAERLGMRFARAADYPDYYPELPGGKVGRAIEVVPVDTKALGSWWATSRGRRDGLPAAIMTDDFWLVSRGWSTVSGALRAARVVGRVAAGAVRGKRLAGMGVGLSAALMATALRLGVRLWLDAPVAEVTFAGDRASGVRIRAATGDVTVTARRGVVIAAGGFDHNAAWRQEQHGVDGAWSSGNEGNLGSGIAVAQAAGAALDLMDDAWWGPTVPAAPGGRPAFMVSERANPYSLIVDASGRRFANESASYVDVGHLMLARRREVPGRLWMVSDARHARRYLRSYAVDPRVVRSLRAAGILHTAPSLAELAARTGVDAAGLAASVERFNGFARTGIDPDFGRGNSAYDRYYGDPSVRPNPNLGPLERAPFTAVEVVPGDLGTKGGIVTDEWARARRPDGSVIDGLYAAGNCSASVMGRTYPGPGATLGPATVFGYVAARHIAGAC